MREGARAAAERRAAVRTIKTIILDMIEAGEFPPSYNRLSELKFKNLMFKYYLGDPTPCEHCEGARFDFEKDYCCNKLRY
jgi:hypothetical protein